MKNILLWIKNNLSHLFSVIGILLTIYFSVYYIPQYSEDLKHKRIEGINNELIGTIQELVYNQQQIDLHDIETLIKGKELRDNVNYPYSVDELLIQVQESFVSNKFITLESRKKLVETIDSIRATIKPIKDQKEPKKFNWLSLISALLGIISSLFATYSLASSVSKQREEEVTERVIEQNEIFQDKIKKAFEFEEFVGKKLELLYGVESVIRQGQINTGVDFMVMKNEKPAFAVEVKFSDNIVSANTIYKLIPLVQSIGCPVIVVSNREPSQLALNLLNKTNSELKNKIKIITINELENIEHIIQSD